MTADTRLGLLHVDIYKSRVLITPIQLVLRQVDIIQAYLNGPLEEEILIEEPRGFETSEGNACRLLKAIYGLKQSGRQWFVTLKAFLIQLGYTQSAYDECVFKNEEVYICFHVDDLIIAGKSERVMNFLVLEYIK